LFRKNAKPSLVVLGVSHSAQLISSGEQPAVLRAFINRVKPNAILIKHSPEEFSAIKIVAQKETFLPSHFSKAFKPADGRQFAVQIGHPSREIDHLHV
jgi:hypothetical protein